MIIHRLRKNKNLFHISIYSTTNITILRKNPKHFFISSLSTISIKSFSSLYLTRFFRSCVRNLVTRILIPSKRKRIVALRRHFICVYAYLFALHCKNIIQRVMRILAACEVIVPFFKYKTFFLLAFTYSNFAFNAYMPYPFLYFNKKTRDGFYTISHLLHLRFCPKSGINCGKFLRV